VVQKIKENEDWNQGFNAATRDYVDMVEAGIIDPVKVTRCALQNASSVASLLLTTDALVSDAPKSDDEAKAAPGGAGFDDMDY